MQTGGVFALRLLGTFRDALESTGAAAILAACLREPGSIAGGIDEKEAAIGARVLERQVVSHDAREVFVEHEHAVAG